MSKRKIHEEKNEISITIERLENFCKELEPLKIGYEKLNIGKFTNEVFTSIKDHGGTKETEAYMKSVFDELDRVGMTNEVTRKLIASGHEETQKEFLHLVQEVNNKRATDYKYLNFDNITYLNGFTVTKENKETIIEANTIYIEDKDQIELYDELLNYSKQMERLKKQINKVIGFELPDHVEVNYIIKEYFTNGKENKFSIKPKGMREFVSRYKKKE